MFANTSYSRVVVVFEKKNPTTITVLQMMKIIHKDMGSFVKAKCY